MTNAIYRDYLMSEDWNQRRKAALARAQWRCQLPTCAYWDADRRAMTDDEIRENEPRRPVLHVHHLTYERFGCENPDDLLVICEDCHAKEHGVRSGRKASTSLSDIIGRLLGSDA